MNRRALASRVVGATLLVSAGAAAQATTPPPESEPVAPARPTFEIDPITDGAIIAVSAGFAFVLNQLKYTSEVRPRPIARDFDRNDLLAIDRGAVTATHHASADTWSDIGANSAIAFAVLDASLSAYREQSLRTGVVDLVLYAETLALAQATSNLVKYAVRRPRPAAYRAAELHRDDPDYSNDDTDSALSFFSGHAATTAGLGATATYLAFTRSPSSWRPWVTLIGGAGLTTFVSIQRVRAGQHFPTDVIVGALAGAGIGVLVPHLHRTEDAEPRRVWVGYAPAPHESGGTLTLGGVF